MNIFTRDRQIVSSPQIDEIEEAIVRFFNQIVASAEEIPRVNLILSLLFFNSVRIKKRLQGSLNSIN